MLIISEISKSIKVYAITGNHFDIPILRDCFPISGKRSFFICARPIASFAQLSRIYHAVYTPVHRNARRLSVSNMRVGKSMHAKSPCILPGKVWQGLDLGTTDLLRVEGVLRWPHGAFADLHGLLSVTSWNSIPWIIRLSRGRRDIFYYYYPNPQDRILFKNHIYKPYTVEPYGECTTGVRRQQD